MKLLCILFCFISVIGNSQDEEFYKENFLRYSDYSYKENIKTVQLFKEGWELSLPVTELTGESKLVLEFDDLDAGIKDYYYTFEHCNANWQPSGLSVSEYLDGFPVNQFSDYKQSFNTFQKYTHYAVSFPNNDVKLKLSGNYIIKVFEDNNPDNLILTRRFCLIDYQVSIEPTVHYATVACRRKGMQEVDFTVKTGNLKIPDPYADLTVVVSQNFRMDNAKVGLKPVYVKDNELVYDYDEENLFPGGSEFRDFDIKNMRFQTENIEQISYKEPFYHVKLFNDERRTIKTYFFRNDLNGKFLVKADAVTDSHTEADYVYVYFTLPVDAPVVDGNVYVYGALSDWAFSKKNLMKYNLENKQYELTLLLKQGFYNYEYMYLKDGSNEGDISYMEGTHYETENDYVFFIYCKDQGRRYDRLIGYQVTNSLIKNK